MSKLRHLRLEGIAHEQRCCSTEKDHGKNRRIRRRLTHELNCTGEAQARRLHAHPFITPMAGIGQHKHQEDHRREHKDVDEKSNRRPEKQHRRPADGRTEENTELTCRGIEPDRALQILAADNVMNDELAPRSPNHSRHSVYN